MTHPDEKEIAAPRQQEDGLPFLKLVDEFEGCAPMEIPWTLFKTKWVPDLIEKKMVVGVNWTGGKVECQADPEELVAGIESH